MRLSSQSTESVHREERSLCLTGVSHADPFQYPQLNQCKPPCSQAEKPLTFLSLQKITAAVRTTSSQTEAVQTQLLNLSNHTTGHN